MATLGLALIAVSVIPCKNLLIPSKGGRDVQRFPELGQGAKEDGECLDDKDEECNQGEWDEDDEVYNERDDKDNWVNWEAVHSPVPTIRNATGISIVCKERVHVWGKFLPSKLHVVGDFLPRFQWISDKREWKTFDWVENEGEKKCEDWHEKMNDGKEEETEDLEICSEEDSPVSDNCMVEEVMWQPYERYSCQAYSCDWSSPDSNESKDEAEDETKKAKDKELWEQEGQGGEPVGDNQGNQDQAEAAKIQTRVGQFLKFFINQIKWFIETLPCDFQNFSWNLLKRFEKRFLVSFAHFLQYVFEIVLVLVKTIEYFTLFFHSLDYLSVCLMCLI